MLMGIGESNFFKYYNRLVPFAKLATSSMESVAVLPWNERQLCYGISGKFGVESVATFAWNTHKSQSTRN